MKLPNEADIVIAKALNEISPKLKTAFVIGPLQSKRGLDEFFESRVLREDVLDWPYDKDIVLWFLSKRANAAINRWLQNSKLSVLAGLSPLLTGSVLVSRERIDHIREHRDNQAVGTLAVVELLRQLFVEGAPTFCANKSTGDRKQGYDQQLVMFNSTYKSKNKEVSGQFPAAILSFSAEPVPHLKIETAYWMHSRKAETLRKGAL